MGPLPRCVRGALSDKPAPKPSSAPEPWNISCRVRGEEMPSGRTTSPWTYRSGLEREEGRRTGEEVAKMSVERSQVMSFERKKERAHYLPA